AAGAWQTGAGEPYAWSPGAALLNLPGFASGAALGGTAWAHPSDLVWARQLWVRAAGWGILVVWLFALIRGRSRPAWMGFAWFAGVLAPVVMLERQFYLYYLACALPGLVASVAFLVAGRETPPARWASWVMVALVVLQGLAIEARATSRLAAAPLPTDFVLRRALIARNAIGDLTRGRDAVGARVVMLGQQPVEAASQGQSTTPVTDYQRDPWWDENVLGALAAGDALKLMLPQVREVTFAPWLAPEDSLSTIAAYGIDGHLTVSEYRTFVSATGGAAPTSLAGHLERAGRFLQRRLFVEARAELLAARALAPDHPDVLLNLGAVEAQLGDSTASLAALTRAVQVAPADVDARFNLGLLQWRMGRREEARATWEPVLREAPGSDLAGRVREVLAGRAH
ncbi:MAG TPA: tetratricopeptide repeat protein, partial [Candidatus Eisenbacteria bacterium]|nr:tetratricopeptide repeat protein [Candidatus Eisenbacteria bacterium]